MRVALALGAWLVASVLVTACGGSTDDGGEGGTCTAVEGCGGDVVGKWDIVDLCVASQPTAPQPECEGAVSYSSIDASGQVEFSADGRTISSFDLELRATYRFTSACLSAQTGQDVNVDEALCDAIETEALGSPTTTEMSCTLLAEDCVCQLAFVNSARGEGGYTISGTDLIGDDASVNPYCVTGDTFRMTVQSSDGTLTYTFRRAP